MKAHVAKLSNTILDGKSKWNSWVTNKCNYIPTITIGDIKEYLNRFTRPNERHVTLNKTLLLEISEL
jgi:hypothetical protein